MLMSESMLQVQVHIYIVSAIYCKLVTDHNMHYGGCASCLHLVNCNTRYILLLLTKNNIYTFNIKLQDITINP